MTTELIRITDTEIDKSHLERAAALLRHGGLVIIPTETVYGLGGDGTNPQSAKKIYLAKGRPQDNPLIIHIADPEDAEKYAYTCDLYFKLAKAFMPGPLTVILKKKDCIPYETTGGLDTVAVRCPSHPIAREIIRLADIPIAAPSANISGKPSATTAEYALEDFDGRVDMIVDGGQSDIGLESTIVMITDDNGLILLRPGAITYDALCCVCDNVKISPTLEGSLNENERPLSPGMKYRHYAPSARFVLLDGEDEDIISFLQEEQKRCRCAILCYDEEAERLSSELLLTIGKRDDKNAHAKALFAGLRKCDSLSPDIIYAHIPDKAGLGLALYNRMIRAASHTVLKIDNNTFTKGKNT